MHEPSAAGRRLWASSAGYLHVTAAGGSEPDRLPCTCTERCLAEDCKGHCGCEACALAWLVREDERALWNEAGELVPPEQLDGPWRRIHDPYQLTLRFQFHAPEKTHG